MLRANSVLHVLWRRLTPRSPSLWSTLPMLCPGAQHCASPMHHVVTVGWMVQRSSNLFPFLRSSGNLLFWKHLRRQVQHFRGNGNTGAPFPFLFLGKAFSPLISTPWGASSPHPSLFFFLLCHSLSPISHDYTLSCLLSISISEKSNWQRDTEIPETPASGSLEKLSIVLN